MNLRTLDLNLLLVFDAIFVEGNVSKAAARIHLSQPAVSNALARLRERFDDPLFERGPGGMQPTRRAKVLAGPVHQALTLLERGMRNTEEFDWESAEREFVIAVEDYGEAILLPSLMDWLSRTSPGVRLRINRASQSQLLASLRDGSVDMALDYFPLRDPAIESVCVLTESLMVLARRDHPEISGDMSLKHYLALRHVVREHRGNVNPMIDLSLAKRGLTRNVALTVPHFLSMPFIVQDSDLICTLPQRMAHLYAEQLQLKSYKVPLRMPNFPVYLLWHQSADRDAGHRWLREQIIAACKAE